MPSPNAREHLRAMGEMLDLKLDDKRLDTVVPMFVKFMKEFEAVRLIDVGDADPATMIPFEHDWVKQDV